MDFMQNFKSVRLNSGLGQTFIVVNLM